MKLKYIIPSLMSVLVFLTGCTEKFEPSYLDGLRVSSSFVALSSEGSSTDFIVNASSSWEFQNVPEWVTVAPLSGGSGETKVTVSAPASSGIKSATVKLVSGALVQEIVISQGKKASAEMATCKQVIDGDDGKTYQVKGTVTNIANTTYGNWYLNDGTGQIYIYGTLDAEGATKNFLSLGLEVGDVVTVEGPKTTYNGTVELVDVTVLKIEKSLVKIVEATPAEITKEGGELTVKLAFKGNLAPTVPDDCNWVRYKTTTVIPGTPTAVLPNPADTAFVKFVIDANEGAGRSAAIAFNCSNASNASSISYTIKQAANVLPRGMRPDDPYNVAEAIKKCQEIGGTSDGEIYYAKGKISSIKEVSTSYGNATFNISDDGTDSNALTCYRSLNLDNQKFTSEDEIAVGDEVVVCGKLVNYTDKNGNATPEFSGNVYIYSIKKGGSPAGGNDGTLAHPYNVKEITALAAKLAENETSEADYYFKGKISTIKYTFSAQYGTATFFISDDGTAADEFQIYGAYYYDGKAWEEGNTQIAVGDEVVIYGKICNYMGTLESASKKAYVYSINGKTK